MPEFKLKKMLSGSRSPSRSRKDTDSRDLPGNKKKEKGLGSSDRGDNSEQHDHFSTPTGSGSHSLLPGTAGTGSSFSGYGSKCSLERQSQGGSDGGLSSLSGSGTDDSGHSSMSSPLNLPMEHLQSFSAVYRAGQHTCQGSVPNAQLLSSQGPPRSVHNPLHHTQRQSGQGHPGHAGQPRATSITASRESSVEGREHDPDTLTSSGICSSRSQQRLRKANIVKNYVFDIGNQRAESRSLESETAAQGRHSAEVYENLRAEGLTHHCAAGLEPGSSLAGDYRNTVIFELQRQVKVLHDRCAMLQKEAELSRVKLGTSMHSVTTFWSPELKKERTFRKEEVARCARLKEQLRDAEAELKSHQNHLLGNSIGQAGSKETERAEERDISYTRDSACVLEGEEDPTKEIQTLQCTVDKLQTCIETQKKTLSARDASIKTLLSILQGEAQWDSAAHKDQGGEAEVTHLQRLATLNRTRIQELENTLNAKEAEIKTLTKLRDSSGFLPASRTGVQECSTDHSLRARIEAKDSHICCLEKEVTVLQDKLLQAQEDLTKSHGLDLDSCVQYSAGTKDKRKLSNELSELNEELFSLEGKQATLRRQTARLQRQHQDALADMEMLTEQLAGKDQQAASLQAEVEALQDRLKAKDGTIERKRKETQAVVSEKQRVEAEVADLRDQLDSKDYHISVLLRKAELRDELLKEKDEQLSRASWRLTSSADPIDSPTLPSLEEAVCDREHQIDRLQQMQEQADRDHQEEMDLYTMTNEDLQAQIEAMRFELTAKRTELCDLRKEIGQLRARKKHTDTKLKQLEMAAQEFAAKPDKELVSVELQTEAAASGEMWSSTDESLTGVMVYSPEHVSPGPSLLEELQKKVSDMEEEKKEKESHMAELQDIIKEYREKVGTLKRNRQKEKEKNEQLLEAAKKREDSFTDDASHLSTAIEQKERRITELEEALRESVRLTALREMDMLELQAQIETSTTAMEEMQSEVEEMRASSLDYTSKLATLTRQLEDKDAKIKRMGAQRQQYVQDLYEIKQEVVEAAIREKEAMIALLEMTGSKKQRHLQQMEHLTLERNHLQAKLLDVTHTLKRMREGRKKGGRSPSRPVSASGNVSDSSSGRHSSTGSAQDLSTVSPEQAQSPVLQESHQSSLLESKKP